MRRLFFLLLLTIGIVSAKAGEPCEVQLVTAEDYGLELDWAIPLKSTEQSYGVGITSIKHDMDGNIYCAGYYKKELEFPDGTKLTKADSRMCSYIAKFTKDGKLEWCKDFYWIGDDLGSINVKDIYGVREQSGEVILSVSINGSKQTSGSYYYDDNHLLDVEKESWAWIILSVAEGDGKLKNTFKIKKEDGLRMPRMDLNFKMMDNGDYIMGGYIDTTFIGVNGYQSECRSKRDVSRYLMRLGADFNVKWDYAYATELTRVGLDARTEGELLCIGDTLYHLFHYEAKDFNLNPEGTPIVVNRKYDDYFDSESGSLILKCDISGNKPQLLGYWHYDQEKMPVNLQKNSKGDIVASKQTYFNSLCSCVKITGNVEVEDIDEIPFQKSSWWWHDYNPVYSFGEEDNIYFLNYDCCEPLSVKFSAESDTVHFKQEEKSFMFSKYGADSTFHYALTTDYVDLEVMNVDDRKGAFYLGAINATNAISFIRVPVDWDPRSDYEVSTYPSKHYVDIVKYTETYRIKPTIVGEGEIMLQDSFVRFGESTIIEIKQKSGWEIDSVCTSRGEKLIGKDGKYKIENVTGVIGVSAYLSQKTNLADEMSNTEFIYPNPADVQIYVNNGKTEFEYEIFDMRGTECLKGKSSAGCINVKALKEGQYILRIEDLLYKFQKIGK